MFYIKAYSEFFNDRNPKLEYEESMKQAFILKRMLKG
jgi:hypothetical protein